VDGLPLTHRNPNSQEISIWIDQRGSADTYDRVNEHLEVLADNSDAIAELMADLIARWKPQEEIDPED
jgi:predicted Zn-dependent peptidase